MIMMLEKINELNVTICVDDVLKEFGLNSTDEDETYDEVMEYMKMKMFCHSGRSTRLFFHNYHV
jgi:hypothetical protein